MWLGGLIVFVILIVLLTMTLTFALAGVIALAFMIIPRCRRLGASPRTMLLVALLCFASAALSAWLFTIALQPLPR